VAEILLKHLAKQLDTLPSSLESLFENCDRMSKRPEFSQLVESIFACAKEFSSVLVLLDAFDECDETQQYDILSLIRQFTTLTDISISVFVTSRPHILGWFQKLQPTILDITAQEASIRMFLTARLEAKLSDKSLQARITDIIANPGYVPEHRFLLADFQLKYVLHMRDPREIVDALNALPVNLNDVYEDIMDRIKGKGENDKKLAMQILSWLFRAARPLRMEELREALSIRPGDKELDETVFLRPETIVEACGSLVVYDECSEIVRFAHYSVQEYLENKGLPSSIHLADTCLTYLAFNRLTDTCPDTESMEIRLRKYKFSEYAARFWGLHTKGEGENSPETRHRIFEVLETSRNSVLQMERYTRIGRSRHYVGVLDYIKGQTLLHVIAQYGLAILCGVLLDRKPLARKTYLHSLSKLTKVS